MSYKKLCFFLQNKLSLPFRGSNLLVEVTNRQWYTYHCRLHHNQQWLCVLLTMSRHIATTMYLKKLKRFVIWNRGILVVWAWYPMFRKFRVLDFLKMENTYKNFLISQSDNKLHDMTSWYVLPPFQIFSHPRYT